MNKATRYIKQLVKLISAIKSLWELLDRLGILEFLKEVLEELIEWF